jgi:nucleotide-binding universal stress UspA family protein
MDRLRNVLVATDFSAASRAALVQGARLAAANDATLHVLHVVPYELAVDLASMMPDAGQYVHAHLTDDSSEQLTEQVHELGLAERAKVRIATGAVVREILAAVDETQADLLAIGVNGASERTGIGTVAIRCVRKSPAKVLLVPPDQDSAFRNIVACVDFSRLAHPVLHQALRVSHLDGGSVTALHVYQVPWERARWGSVPECASQLDHELRRVLSAQLGEVLAPLNTEAEGVDLQLEVTRNPDHGEGIVEFAGRNDADLVVLGTTGRSALAYFVLLGTTAEKVIRDIGCAVLAVKLPVTLPTTTTVAAGADE